LPEGPLLVVGLARSGQAVARMLAVTGRQVVAVDAAAPDGAAGLTEVGVEVVLDVDGTEFLDRVKTLVKSPGVPGDAAVIGAARERGIAVVGELDLAWRALPNAFVAVTGTNGKTTVVEWLAHVWEQAGLEAVAAGNVGTPLSSLVGRLDEDATVICECSSFQLEDAVAFAPEIAVLLNVTPDHIDRHRSFDAYRDAKLRIFTGQGEGDYSIFDADEVSFAASDRPGDGATIAYGASACAEGGCLVRIRGEAIEADGRPLVALEELALPGRHNARNAMAVTAAALCAGLPVDAIARGLREFGGVPHRLESVGEHRGVRYINDSKATNVAAAGAALRAFDGGVHVILGGSLKGGGFEALAPAVEQTCRAAYLIGEAASTLRRALQSTSVELRDCETLEAAVGAAAAAASPGETVLLAPACASFDAFDDYEHRGRRFRELVRGLG